MGFILDQQLLSQRESVNIAFKGPEPTLKLGALNPSIGIKPVKLFVCQSITTKDVIIPKRIKILFVMKLLISLRMILLR